MSNLLDRASVVLTPTAYNNGEALCIKPDDASGDFDFSRNSAATRVNAQGLVENVQILSSNLVQNGDFSEEGVEEVSNGSFSQEGAELVTNGNFATDSDWNGVGSNGVDISNGSLNYSETPNGTNITQGGVVEIGKSYKVTFTISNYVKGGILVVLGAGGTTQEISANGTFTIYGVASINTTLYIQARGASGTTLSIDNFSVREVGQDWTLGTGWSIGENKAVRVSTGTYTPITQGGILTAGKSYKVNYTINDGSVGGVRVQLGGTYSGDYNGVGTHTVYGVAGTSDFNNFKLVGEPSFNGSITNISVKEVGQNWTLINGTITDKYNASLTSYQSGIRVTPFLNTGTFKVTFDLVVTSGSCKFDAGGANNAIYTTSGTKEIMVTDTTKFEFNAFNLGWVGTLDNISVIQITTDTNLPRINYEGFSYQDALGSELVVNGDFATDSDWSKGTGWSISGGVSTANNVPNLQRLQSTGNAPSVIGSTYKYSIDVSNVSGFYSFYIYGVYVLASVSTEGLIEGYVTATSTNGAIWIAGATISGLISATIDNVSVKEYLGQEVVPNSGCGHYLWEPQSTNLIPYSETFSDSSWLKEGGAIIELNTSTSPDGSINASYLKAPIITNETVRISNTFSATSSQTYLGSIFVKKDNIDYIRILSTGATASTLQAFYNVSNGTLGSAGTPSKATIEDYGNGWYRLGLIIDAVNTTSNATFRIQLAKTDGAVINNFDGTEKNIIWGAQLEQQTYATSYIPTEGEANGVTRNQDVCTNGATETGLINSTEGVLYAEIAALANDNSFRLISLTQGTNGGNRLYLGFTNTSNQIRVRITSGGATQVDITQSLSNIKDFNKIAFKYKENDFALWVNGIKVATDTNGLTAIGLNNLSFETGSSLFFGKTKALAVWKEALSDQELTELTTI